MARSAGYWAASLLLAACFERKKERHYLPGKDSNKWQSEQPTLRVAAYPVD